MAAGLDAYDEATGLHVLWSTDSAAAADLAEPLALRLAARRALVTLHYTVTGGYMRPPLVCGVGVALIRQHQAAAAKASPSASKSRGELKFS